MRSGECARLAGVSSDTLRHYERLGLLPSPSRTGGGYRNYPESALLRISLIRSALSVGFSLFELQTILKMRDAGQVPCHRVREMAQSKVELLNRQIKGLVVMRGELARILKKWDTRLAHTRKGVPARLLETMPKDLTPGISPFALTTRDRKELRCKPQQSQSSQSDYHFKPCQKTRRKLLPSTAAQ
jgi:DNA-binding transcriptional MerR regulator